MRRGEHRHAAAGRLQRQRAIARLHGHALGLQSVQRDTPQRAVGVVEDGLGVHIVARLTIGGRCHVEPGVVVVRDVRVVRCQDGFLLNQPAARVERVSQTAVEAAHAQAVEDNLHSFAHAARRGATKLKCALHVARSVRVRRRIVEEGVPPASALASLPLIEGPRAADDGFAVWSDGRDERLCGVERERRAPDAGRLVRPRHRHRVVAADDADGPRLHAREIERHGHRWYLERCERSGAGRPARVTERAWRGAGVPATQNEDQSREESAAHVHGGGRIIARMQKAYRMSRRLQSIFNATTGSTAAARRAGSRPASVATATMSAAAPPSDNRSVALTSMSRVPT